MAAPNRPLKAILSSVLAMATAMPASKAFALEWSASPAVTIGAEYNDNISLRATTPDSGWNYSVTPQATLGAAAQDWNLSGRAQISRIQYPGNSLQSRTDHLLDLTYNELGELNQWTLAGNLTRDSTLESELSLTGIALTRTQRSSRTLSPSWTHFFAQLYSITLGYSYDDVSYDAVAGTSLLDYKNQDVSATLTHILSETDKANISLDYAGYKTSNPVDPVTSQYHSTTVSAQLGYIHAFSETLHGALTAGMHRTNSVIDFEECFGSFAAFSCFPLSASTTGTGSLLNASLEQTYESSKLTATLSRSLQPTGNGGLVQTDRFDLHYSDNLAATLTGVVDFGVYDSQSLNNTSSASNTSRYYVLRPALTWQMTEQWTGYASYARSQQHHTNAPDAISNAIYLTFNYAWPKISVSR